MRRHLKTISGSDTASFVYDALGRRMKKTVNGTTTQFLYDGLNPVQEQNSSGAVIANMLTGLNIDEYFIRSEPSCCGPLSYLTDALGSTIELADSSGANQDSYSYDPFGNTSVCLFCAPTTSSYLFTGRELDLQSGLTTTALYYYRGRYYSPVYQRFISQDPIDFAGGDTNLYAYAVNDSVNLVDPLGLYTEIITFDPVGSGRSSCGHTAIDINGEIYSFGEKGWASKQDFNSYMKNNLQFRSATGQVLNLTPAEEGSRSSSYDRKRHCKETSMEHPEQLRHSNTRCSRHCDRWMDVWAA